MCDAVKLGISGALICVALWAGCSGDKPQVELRPVEPIISQVRSSLPITTGTTLRVTVANLDALGQNPELTIGGSTLMADSVEGSEARFIVPASLVNSLGDGAQVQPLVVRGLGLESAPFDHSFEVASSIAVELGEGIRGSFYRNDLAVVDGAGFLEASEGDVVALVSGTFSPESGGSSQVEVELPVFQAELGNRRRGAVRLTAGLSGIVPGAFAGQVRLESRAVTGATSRSVEFPINVDFEEPLFLALEPSVTSLESIVRVRGAGFLGNRDDEVTIMRVDGTFTPMGSSPQNFREDLVLRWVSGSELEWDMTAERSGDRLRSMLFGHARGQLSATFTPITVLGSDEYEGVSGTATLTLGPQRQVVYVKLLPGFFESLPQFGLAAAAALLKDAIVERLEGIYADYNVDFRTERPTDVTPSGVTTIEVGGPDPNGLGLFGYDNSPGKDVGNLRLGDTIGGANAETLMDGSPGYGGVFIVGFLFFSESDPPESGFGPEPDPLFDEIFSGVRRSPATLAEVQGQGERAAEVARAIRALANMIGETTAHELGHSFGLANPEGSPTAFHNSDDRPGCLMDRGVDRPFGERIAEPGFSRTRLCGTHVDYMNTILGR